MTNLELAALLNSTCGLSDANSVTVNVVRQWVKWRVIAPAKAKGRVVGTNPEWCRDETTMRRAMRLAQLRKLGVIRKDAVIVQAFLEWGYPNLETVRQSMVRELRKCLAILMRMRTSRLDGRAYKDTGAARQKAIKNQLGRLDARFVGTRYQQSAEFYATIAESAETGAVDATRINALISTAFAQMLPNYEAITSTISIDIISKSFQGLLGSPDEIENSVETRISHASERELRIARVNRSRTIAALKKAAAHTDYPISELADLLLLIKVFLPQISVAPWAVMHFAQSFENCVTGEKSAVAVS